MNSFACSAVISVSFAGPVSVPSLSTRYPSLFEDKTIDECAQFVRVRQRSASYRLKFYLMGRIIQSLGLQNHSFGI